jgi:hypothetical protein
LPSKTYCIGATLKCKCRLDHDSCLACRNNLPYFPTRQTSVNAPRAESLESRQFLSAAPLPSITGDFSGQVNFSNGATDSIVLDITSQKKGSFSGESFQGDGATAKLKGSVNKKGVVHATLRGINVHFSSKIIGAVSGDTLAAAFSTKQGKLRLSGTFSLSRVTPA